MGSYGANDIDAAIAATAARAGMSVPEWKAIAAIESNLTPQSNQNAGTQYKGLYQIGSYGPKSEWATHGSGDIYNPMDNATAAANLAAENNAGFQRAFGRAPTPIETYMMHQQGLGFYTRGSLTNVAGNLPKEDRTPENMTHDGLQAYYAAKMARLANKFQDPDNPSQISYSLMSGGGGGTGSVPSGATASATGAIGGGGAQAEAEDSSSDEGGAGDFASKMAAVTDKIAKQGEGQTMQLAPMQFQPVMTPAMMRTKQLVQAMLQLNQGNIANTGSGS